MSDREQREAQDDVTESAKGTSTALDDLSAAAARADATFTNGILSIPRTLGDAVADIVGDRLASPVRFFEARFQTLRQLTDYGINFNYSMETMETAVNEARMDLSQFAGMVNKNSEAMGLFGENISDGTQVFLNTMAVAFDQVQANGNTIETNLARLGYTTDEITETFLNYQQQMVFSGVRNRRDQAATNKAAAEFAENLDELSALTGKQRDQLAEEALEVSRRGDIMARARQLPENVRTMLGETVNEFEQEFGPLMGGLVSDILGPGFAQGQSVALQTANEELSNTLYRMRAAFEAGNSQEVERLQGLAAAQASRFLDSEEFINMAVYRGTQFGNTLAEAGEQIANSANFVRQNVRDRLLREGKPADDQAVADEIARMQRERRESAQGQAETAYNQFVDTQIELERAAQQARRIAVEESYNYLSGTITRVGGLFEGLVTRLSGEAERQAGNFGGVIDDFLDFIPGSDDADIQAEINRAGSLGPQGQQIAGQMAAIAEQLQTATGERRAELQNELERLLEQSRRLEAQNMIINANNVQIRPVDEAALDRLFPRTPGETPQEPNSIGTMGTRGRLFRNFGKESLVPLHNIEAVMTPRQMGELVERSASGMAQAIVNQIDQASSNNAVSAIMSTSFTTQDQLRVLQGNLNSIVRSVRESSITGSPAEINLDGLENEIRQLASQMRGPLEEALTGALRPHLEQLVGFSKTTAETNSRIQRNIRGVVGDYTKGA